MQGLHPCTRPTSFACPKEVGKKMALPHTCACSVGLRTGFELGRQRPSSNSKARLSADRPGFGDRGREEKNSGALGLCPPQHLGGVRGVNTLMRKTWMLMYSRQSGLEAVPEHGVGLTRPD
jgi:hypothetical protein